MIIGGTVNFKALNSLLSEKEYSIHKIYAWSSLLNDGNKPIKWYKPTKSGTKVAFEVLFDDVTAQTALGEFKGYIAGINLKYPDVEMTLSISEEAQE